MDTDYDRIGTGGLCQRVCGVFSSDHSLHRCQGQMQHVMITGGCRAVAMRERVIRFVYLIGKF